MNIFKKLFKRNREIYFPPGTTGAHFQTPVNGQGGRIAIPSMGPHGPVESDFAYEEDDPRPHLAGIPQRYPMTAQELHQAEPAAREGNCPEGF